MVKTSPGLGLTYQPKCIGYTFPTKIQKTKNQRLECNLPIVIHLNFPQKKCFGRQTERERERESEAMAASATSGVFLGNTSNVCFRRTGYLYPKRTKAQAVSELGFVTSQLSGTKISYDYSHLIQPVSVSFTPPLQPIVARKYLFLCFLKQHFHMFCFISINLYNIFVYIMY